MQQKQLDQLVTLITAIVNDDDAWRDKRDAIMDAFADDTVAATAFNEFIAWFEKEED